MCIRPPVCLRGKRRGDSSGHAAVAMGTPRRRNHPAFAGQIPAEDGLPQGTQPHRAGTGEAQCRHPLLPGHTGERARRGRPMRHPRPEPTPERGHPQPARHLPRGLRHAPLPRHDLQGDCRTAGHYRQIRGLPHPAGRQATQRGAEGLPAPVGLPAGRQKLIPPPATRQEAAKGRPIPTTSPPYVVHCASPDVVIFSYIAIFFHSPIVRFSAQAFPSPLSPPPPVFPTHLLRISFVPAPYLLRSGVPLNEGGTKKIRLRYVWGR